MAAARSPGSRSALTFEVKPFEGLVAAPGLALIAWLGLPRGRPALAGAGAVLVTAALAWLVALPLLGGGHLPWAYGSTNGSAWDAAFVYDGIGRLGEHARPAASAASLARIPAAAGPLRLFESRDGLGLRVGLELGAAILVAAVSWCRATASPARAGGGCSRGWRPASCSPRRRPACDRATSRAWTRRSRPSSAPARCSPRAAGCSPRSARCSWVHSSCHVARGRPPRRGLRDAGRAGARAHRGAHPLGADTRRRDRHVGGRARRAARRGRRPRRRVPRGRSPSARHAGRARGRRMSAPRCSAAPAAPRAAGAPPPRPGSRAHGTDVSRRLGQPSPGLAYDLSAGTRSGSRTSAASRRSRRRR